MIPAHTLERITRRFEEIEAQLASGAGEFVRLSRERAQLKPVIDAISDYQTAERERVSLEQLLQSGDAEMAALAREELFALKVRLPVLETTLKLRLLPKDAADDGNVILEVRAGTGGEEASLFAADLLRMYQRFAQLKGWRSEILSLSETGLGGIKEAAMEIAGEGVYAQLKFESGVHRVQRVPVTEASGRIHTSAATVAVLPEAEDVDVTVNESDLRIDVFRASGAGGQHVNKTESAVRITHLPTGLVVACQAEKSQHKNRAQAMKVLKARLFDLERQRVADMRAADRKGQVGSGDRSERIRTYNFPQGRVTDHRINMTVHDLDRVIAGDMLSRITDALVSHDQAERLADMEGDRA